MKLIMSSIGEGLAACRDMLVEVLRSDIGLIDQVARHLLSTGGKLIRPRLVLLSAAACGECDGRAISVATAVELLHTGALIHDDVIDSAQLRRGLPSLNSRWNDHISVLMGDYLFSKSFCLMVNLDSHDLLGIFSRATERMSRGEMLQVELSRGLKAREEDYLRVISDKTASLFSASCEMGAALATDRLDPRKHLARFGENLGCAYQIIDDLLDLIGVENLIGKPVGEDIKGGKWTLPLIYSLQKAPGREAQRVRELIKRGGDAENWPEVAEFIECYGGIDYARLKAEGFAQVAREELETLEDSEAKRELAELVAYTLTRSR